MRRTLGALVLAGGAVFLAAVGWTAARPSDAVLAVETVLKLRVAAAVLAAEVPEGQAFPEPHGTFVPVTTLRGGMDPQHRALVDAKDAWGRPFLYWSNGDRYILLSYGADGAPEVSYDGLYPWLLVSQGAPTDANTDILLLDGELWRGPGTSRDNLRRVMASMRAVGTAIESYSVDFSHYPESFGYNPVQVLESTLEPVYIRALPLTDPWQGPFWVQSVAADAYALVSYGSDGEPEFPYASWQAADWDALNERGTTEPGQDVIFRNGQFVRWPATLPR